MREATEMTEKQPTTDPTAHLATVDGPIADTVLQSVRDAAGKAGAAAADTWAHTALRTRDLQDAANIAREIIATLDSSGNDSPAPQDTALTAVAAAYTAAAGPHAPGFDDLTPAGRDELHATYLEVHARVRRQHTAAHCRTALAGHVPAGDWSHLAYDKIGIGGIGVFAGDWAGYRTADGTDRIRVGFVGLLIDTWNGWAVFTCTRQVAEAIVADQGWMRADLHARESARGQSETEAAASVDASMCAMWFDGDTIVVDQRAVDQDPDSIDRITARADGSRVVMGWNWCWTVVSGV